MNRNPQALGIAERVRFALATFALSTPSVYYALTRLGLKRPDLTVTADTELVIEGFPRSGNSFSVAAFQSAQKRDVPVAHHHHAQAQVIRAARRGIPVLVLIRKPADAVRSLIVRSPSLPVAYALRKYERFYVDIEPYRDRFVVGPFEEVTRHFDRTIERINRRFDTRFLPFPCTEEAVQAVFDQIERTNREFNKGRRNVIAKPDPQKEVQKGKISFAGHELLLERSDAVHRRFLEYAEHEP